MLVHQTYFAFPGTDHPSIKINIEIIQQLEKEMFLDTF